jgi:1-acyl-sn-glycerol-3-phosphate acyltransferase
MSKRPKNKIQSVDSEVVQEIIEGSLGIDEEVQSATLEKLYRILQLLASPTIVGAENIPEGPVLFIGNHSTMAADVLVVIPALQQASGRFVRGMSDEIMYRNTFLRKRIVGSGAVMGHQEIGSALFEAGKDILLFPGGAYEANKNLDERYAIKWKQRTGFVRMAAKHGVPIVPVGIVGPDEWFGRYMDRGEVANSWLANLMKRAGASDEFINSDQLPPIPKGLFGTWFPKPQRVYIGIGEPIETIAYKGKTISAAAQNKLRDVSKERLQQCIADMLLLRTQDRKSVGILRRILTV